MGMIIHSEVIVWRTGVWRTTGVILLRPFCLWCVVVLVAVERSSSIPDGIDEACDCS